MLGPLLPDYLPLLVARSAFERLTLVTEVGFPFLNVWPPPLGGWLGTFASRATLPRFALWWFGWLPPLPRWTTTSVRIALTVSSTTCTYCELCSDDVAMARNSSTVRTHTHKHARKHGNITHKALAYRSTQSASRGCRLRTVLWRASRALLRHDNFVLPTIGGRYPACAVSHSYPHTHAYPRARTHTHWAQSRGAALLPSRLVRGLVEADVSALPRRRRGASSAGIPRRAIVTMTSEVELGGAVA